jgi:hypothetical protein
MTTLAYVAAKSCQCAAPVRVERAERKGAASTECARCGLPVPLRLGR